MASPRFRSLGLIFLFGSSILSSQCNYDLFNNGSFTSAKGEGVIAPGWSGTSSPDVNSAVGPLKTTPGYHWCGTPLSSPNGGTWQNMFGKETITQSVTTKPSEVYNVSFYYASQGIEGSVSFSAPVGAIVMVNGAGSFTTAADVTPFTWEFASFTFTATDNVTTITFSPTAQEYLAVDGACVSMRNANNVGLFQGSTDNRTGFKIVPNPVEDISVILFEEDFAELSVLIYNMHGQKVFEDELTSPHSYELRKESLTPGTYILYCWSESKLLGRQSLIINGN
jgi:hypothetical protein